MAQIRMLALDVDGTLAAEGDRVTEPTVRALRRARAAGIEIVLATGRRFRSTARVIDRLGFEIAAICLGGALVKETDQRTLHQQPFEARSLVRLAEALHEAGLTFVGQRDSHAQGGADFVVDGRTPHEAPVAHYLAQNAEHAHVRTDLAERPPEDVLVVGTWASRAPLEAFAHRLMNTEPDGYVTTLMPSPSSDHWYLEITTAAVSKWSGLTRLAAVRGVAPQEICAAGDELNDLSMVRGAGIGVAMENAHPELKAASDWVCGRNDEDGLVGLIDRLLSA